MRITIALFLLAITLGCGQKTTTASKPAEHDDHKHVEMPDKLDTDDEAALFLTPGGKYTQADIEKNGKTVPTKKYKGIRAKHDDHPKPGDVLCPISMTKANPKFTWVINGKTYEFCCTPCIEEFVAAAKEKPNELKDPGEFIKK